MDRLKEAKLFLTLDLWYGYNNVWIKEGDEWKAAFVIHKGTFKLVVMCFGLCNSPFTFQTIMNELFTDMADIVIVYINDVTVAQKTVLMFACFALNTSNTDNP